MPTEYVKNANEKGAVDTYAFPEFAAPSEFPVVVARMDDISKRMLRNSTNIRHHYRMRPDLVKILLSILLIVLLALIFRATANEGFTGDTIMNKVQDRANPLAAQQNPVTNPASQIGITQASGSSLRSMSQTALNIPMQVPEGGGGLFTTKSPVNTLSPRIDNESSFLSLVNFCKNTGASMSDPFSDPNFAANCGMCTSSGTLITGETFTTPTGVVVYQKDKDSVNDTQTKNRYKFPRAIPSLNSATCQGASLSDDTVAPVLAINSKMLKEIKGRNACRTNQTFGNSCGQCTADTNSWSYVENPPNGGISETTLVLYGKGTVQVSVQGAAVGSPKSLSMTATVINIGIVTEGSTIKVSVTPDSAGNSPMLYAAMKNTLPNGSDLYLPFDDLINKDEVTGSYPRRLSPMFFADVNLALSQILPSAGQPQGSVKMILDATMPLTFVSSDQIASYDCATGPYTTSQADAELYSSGNDPCLNPPGQGPNRYSEECLQSKIFAAGCSAGGEWYASGLPGAATIGKTIGQINSWLQDMVTNHSTDPSVTKGCSGADTSTPCDQFIGTTQIPNQQCLAYLFANTGARNPRLSASYSSAESFKDFKSLQGNTDQFCQHTGTLNPSTAAGLAELKNVASGYGGYQGVDAVKAYLSDTFSKSVGNLDINMDDSAGGRKTSWTKCFGIQVDDVPVVTTNIIIPKTNIAASFSRGAAYATVNRVDSGQAQQPGTLVLVDKGETQVNLYWVYFKVPPNPPTIDQTLYISGPGIANPQWQASDGARTVSPGLWGYVKSIPNGLYDALVVKLQDAAPGGMFQNSSVWPGAVDLANNSSTAIYSFVAKSPEKLAKSLAHETMKSGAVKVNPCPPATGNPVYESVEVGTPGNSPWYGWGGWENNAPPAGNGVKWIWATKNANSDAPAGPYYNFSYNYCNNQNITSALLACGIDNIGTVTLNGATIFTGGGGFGQKTVTLVPGQNTIVINAMNQGGPAGVWLALTSNKPCNSWTFVPNKNYNGLACPPGSSDAVGNGRCHVQSLSAAQAMCDANPSCVGVTKDNGGYEPRSGGFQDWGGMNSWSCSNTGNILCKTDSSWVCN